MPATMLTELSPKTRAYYIQAIRLLKGANVPFLVGGAYALETYTGIARHTKDFDVFLLKGDVERALYAFQNAGYKTEISFPHWLAKAYQDEDFVDLIFCSGNGLSTVDTLWFERAVEREVFGEMVQIVPPEEIVWQKAFIMERERFDGADIHHLLLGAADRIDWEHLLNRFAGYERILLSHLILFGFVFPSDRNRIPRDVMDRLLQQVSRELDEPAREDRVCHGTLVSRAQYLVDVKTRGYSDARLPHTCMTEDDIELWTAGIANDGPGGIPHVPEGANQ